MTTMTIAPAATGGNDDSSFDAGFLDGEIAATTDLPYDRAAARIAMAEQYDPMYAEGYADGYLYGAATLAAHDAESAR